MIRNAVLGHDINVEFELGDEALLVPKPNDKAVVRLSSLSSNYPKNSQLHQIERGSAKRLTRVKRKFVSFSSE